MKHAFLKVATLIAKNLLAYVCKYVCKDENQNGIPNIAEKDLLSIKSYSDKLFIQAFWTESDFKLKDRISDYLKQQSEENF